MSAAEGTPDVRRVGIRRLVVSNLGCLDRLRLDLDGLTVLIGDNGTGKSTILECLELLRRAGAGTLRNDLSAIHAAGPRLGRRGRKGPARISLLIAAEDGGELAYSLDFEFEGYRARIRSERLYVRENGSASEEPLFEADFETGKALVRKDGLLVRAPAGEDPLIGSPFAPIDDPRVDFVRSCLRGMANLVQFETLTYWAARAYDRRSASRVAAPLVPCDSVDPLGSNLAAAYFALKNAGSEHWRKTLDVVRGGFRPETHDVEDVVVAPDASGQITLALKLVGGDRSIPALALSDGELAYLALVAAVRLDEGRSALTFDEPDLHLHPSLLFRMVSLFERAAAEYPVVLTTHSQGLLNFLSDPARSVVVCERDPVAGGTLIRRLDPDALARWIDRYAGFGALTADGVLPMVLKKPEDPGSA